MIKLSVVMLALVAMAVASDPPNLTCQPYFVQYCDRMPPYDDTGLKPCSPLYGAVDKRASPIRKYIKEHIGNSFEYLLQWANFNNYKKDREGFAKLYRKLADDTWEDAIKLTKYMGKRGLELDFEDLLFQKPNQKYGLASGAKHPTESEMISLAKTLDLHKQLAISGNTLHQDSVKHDAGNNKTRSDNQLHHDYEFAHFVEEEFSSKHAQTVRELAGLSSDLRQLLKEGGRDNKLVDASGFYVHLFDEYLRKLY